MVVGLAVLGDSLLYAVLPTRYATFGVPLELVGVLLSANRLVRLAFNSVAGRAYERWGPGRPFLVGATLGTLTTGLMALLPGFWPLLVIRLAWGACWSLLRLGGYVAVLRWAGARRGSALGVFWTMVRCGMLLGGFGGALLVDALDVRTALVLLTLVTAIAIPVAAVMQAPLDETRSNPVPAADTGAGPPAPWWRDRSELGVCVATAVLAFAIPGCVFATLGLILSDRFGSSVALGALVVGVTTLAGALLGAQRAIEIVAAPGLGHLADAVGPRGLVFVGLGIGGLAALLLAWAPDPAWLIVSVLLLWIGSAVAVVGLDIAAASLAQGHGGARLLARYATWIDLGAAGGPITGYWLATVAGVQVLPLFAAMLVLASLLAFAAGLPSGAARTVHP